MGIKTHDWFAFYKIICMSSLYVNTSVINLKCDSYNYLQQNPVLELRKFHVSLRFVVKPNGQYISENTPGVRSYIH